MANQFVREEEEEEMERKSRVRYNPSQARSNVNGCGINRGSAEMASRFGGWDELDRHYGNNRTVQRKLLKLSIFQRSLFYTSSRITRQSSSISSMYTNLTSTSFSCLASYCS
ncbi:hypothetical protein EUTSA_v10029243mg [Eutrema salsugineum]|uniref:Uncharacterized protein n=1 Tax=Eutrema salsugineum TaxID=72664 RepID=V4L2P7_EUTSA|nr:hypothetical protein EUTSA_v10029243mg [Eutrema salsugineum]